MEKRALYGHLRVTTFTYYPNSFPVWTNRIRVAEFVIITIIVLL